MTHGASLRVVTGGLSTTSLTKNAGSSHQNRVGMNHIPLMLSAFLLRDPIPHCAKHKASTHSSHPHTLSSTTAEIKTLCQCPYFPSLCIVLQYVVSEMAMRSFCSTVHGILFKKHSDTRPHRVSAYSNNRE